MILAVPIQAPATKFASEYHGGKQGRFCYHQKALNGRITFEPVLCRRCKQHTVVFDEREVPYCTNCNESMEPGRELHSCKRQRIDTAEPGDTGSSGSMGNRALSPKARG